LDKAIAHRLWVMFLSKVGVFHCHLENWMVFILLSQCFLFYFSDGFQAFPNNGFEQECWYTFSIHTSQHRMTNHDWHRATKSVDL
jgi:hypothetical protein